MQDARGGDISGLSIFIIRHYLEEKFAIKKLN
jgi:hypothetical protein